MHSAVFVALSALAIRVAGLILRTPTTIPKSTCKCPPAWETEIDTIIYTLTVTTTLGASTIITDVGLTVTETSTMVAPTTVVSTSYATVTSTKTADGGVTIATVTSVRISTATFIQITTKLCSSAVSCPTLTATGTVCRTCTVPACAILETVTKPAACTAALATTTVDFPCSVTDSCNKIGCKTQYELATAY